MVGRFFKCALVLSLISALSSSCSDSDNPVGPSPVLLNRGDSTSDFSVANGSALQSNEEFNCTHLEEWFVRFSDPGSVEANIATLFYNYVGAPAGTKTLEIFWDYENESTKAEYIQLGLGDLQRDDDGLSNYMGLVQHVYRNITESTRRVVRAHFIADGKTGNCATVRRITVTPPTDDVVASAATPICGTITFTNPAPVNILSVSTASPYPSNIVVSGMGGTISNVTATVNNVDYPISFTFQILLVAPGLEDVLLMSFMGGAPVVDETWTFDDAAASFMPDFGSIGSGTWRPSRSSFIPPSPLNPPAPPPGPGYGFSFGAAGLIGTDPNGTWSLFVQEFFGGGVGAINGGWSLTITTTCP
jgi:subtilisin-like proprotein convertase family protein